MNNRIVLTFFSLLIVAMVLLVGCGKAKAQDVAVDKDNNKYKVTFIELGSVRCVPCRMMEPILNWVKKKYKGKVKVVFHDVWKDREYARIYNVRVIPTQIFIDSEGNEFFRHEGFLPQKKVEAVLKMKL